MIAVRAVVMVTVKLFEMRTIKVCEMIALEVFEMTTLKTCEMMTLRAFEMAIASKGTSSKNPLWVNGQVKIDFYCSYYSYYFYTRT